MSEKIKKPIPITEKNAFNLDDKVVDKIRHEGDPGEEEMKLINKEAPRLKLRQELEKHKITLPDEYYTSMSDEQLARSSVILSQMKDAQKRMGIGDPSAMKDYDRFVRMIYSGWENK